MVFNEFMDMHYDTVAVQRNGVEHTPIPIFVESDQDTPEASS